jgi:pimeloyl-ACP methyl ester carboxylesterase
MAPIGRDGSVVLDDGRVLEYWEGGDPNGRGVIFHPGTPGSRILGRWGHEAALAAKVRLVAVSRPGYGGSTPVTGPPFLLPVGRDTAMLANRLGIEQFAVFGTSGGGPFAIATAVAAPSAVRAVGVVGGIGPWRLLEAPETNAEDRECLALLDAGDVDGTFTCFSWQVEQQQARRSVDEAVAAILDRDDSEVARVAGYRALWTENMRDIRDNPQGYVYDNVAWGADWDVDARDVVAPALLLYGTADVHCSAERHGQWYADRIPDSELVVVPSAGHLDVIDGHWPAVLAGLLRIWAS